MEWTEESKYREYHEKYMEDHNGTTFWENLALIAPTPFLIFYLSLIKIFLYYQYRLQKGEKLLLFLLDFTFLIAPLTLFCTVLSSYLVIALAFFSVTCAASLYLLLKKNKRTVMRFLQTDITQEKKPYLTIFRSVVSVYSVICILAVDFKIFPRRFAKTETFGYGFMDTGVALYVIANGIVQHKTKHSKLLFKNILGCIPLVVLGFLRLILTESVQYQKHVSEYGVHWNFFFTLAFVKFVSTFFLWSYPKSRLGIALGIGVIHQTALYGIQDYILSDTPRDSFFAANREGLLSLPGYVSLCFIGVSAGSTLRNKVNTVNSALEHSSQLAIASAVFTVATVVTESFFGVSRRLVNLPYILWITSLVLFILCLCLLVEVAIRTVCFAKKVPVKAVMIPVVLDAINYNGLIFFLIANLLTGLVNLSFKTLLIQPVYSVIILLCYMFVNCSLILILYFNHIKLKFW